MAKFLVPLLIITLVIVFFRRKKTDEKEKLNETKETANAVEMRQDPVCSSYVEETTKYKVKYYDKIFYFCSEECKNKFIEQKKQENQA